MNHPTITLPRADYNNFCDQLQQNGHISPHQATTFKELGHIAPIDRTETTEFIFTQHHITSNLAVIMVEGSTINTITYRHNEEMN